MIVHSIEMKCICIGVWEHIIVIIISIIELAENERIVYNQ